MPAVSFYFLYSQINKLRHDELVSRVSSIVCSQLDAEERAKALEIETHQETEPINQSIIERDRGKLKQILGTK